MTDDGSNATDPQDAVDTKTYVGRYRATAELPPMGTPSTQFRRRTAAHVPRISPKPLPGKALAGGAVMALVPFALAVALMVALLGPDSPDAEDAAPSSEPAESIGSAASAAADTVTSAASATATPSDPVEAEGSTSTSAAPDDARSVPTAPIVGAGIGAGGSGCTPGANSLPDGIWFVEVAAWSDTAIEVDLVCAYGGADAVAEMQRRGETGDPGSSLYLTNDNPTLRSLRVVSDATAQEIQSNSGAVGPVVDWPADIADLGLSPTTADRVRGWVHVQEGAAVHFQAYSSTLLLVAGPGPAEEPACTTAVDRLGDVVVQGIPTDDPDGGLNIRSRPSLDGRVLGTEPNGAVVEVIGACLAEADGFTWLEVDYPGGPGWAASDYLVGP